MSRNSTKSKVSELSLPVAVTALPLSPKQWTRTLNTYAGQRIINVNRLRYQNIPIDVTPNCHNAGRDDLIQNFWQSLITIQMSDNSCFVYFNKAVTFLRVVDKLNFNLYTSEGVLSWIQAQHTRVLSGEITESTASAEVGSCRKFVTLCGLDSSKIFPKHNPFSERAKGKKDICTLPYTQKEERQLLRAIENLYQQLKLHFYNTPEEPFAVVSFEGRQHKVPTPTNLQQEHPTFYQRVLTGCVFYKISAYTGYNTSTLTNLKLSQVQRIDTENGHIYRLNPTKGRKSGEIDSKDISTSKHVAFMDEWLSLLSNFGDLEGQWFFPVMDIEKGGYRSLNNVDVTALLNRVIQRIYHPINEKGMPLRLSASRFRKNRNLIAHYVAGPIMAARDANHSIAVEDRFYGTIHPHDGMKQTAAAIDVLAQLGTPGLDTVNVQNAKAEVARRWNIELLPLDDAFQRYGNLSPMPNGIRCKNGYEGINPEKYRRKNQQSGNSDSHNLPCTLYQSCLSCSQAVVIDSDDDAYLLLSFREYIANSTAMHVDGNHLDKNYGELLGRIDTTISMLSLDNVGSAKQRVFDHGLHPFWNRFMEPNQWKH